jgi:hypothetical protein
MLRKTLTIALTTLLLNLAAAAPARAAAARQTAGDAEKARVEVGKLGAGTRVDVKLASGAKMRGDIGESDGEGFMLVDSKGNRTRVAYSDVKSVKRFKKSNWKTFDAKEFAIGAGLIGGIFLVAIWGVSQTK